MASTIEGEEGDVPSQSHFLVVEDTPSQDDEDDDTGEPSPTGPSPAEVMGEITTSYSFSFRFTTPDGRARVGLRSNPNTIAEPDPWSGGWRPQPLPEIRPNVDEMASAPVGPVASAAPTAGPINFNVIEAYTGSVAGPPSPPADPAVSDGPAAPGDTVDA